MDCERARGSVGGGRKSQLERWEGEVESGRRRWGKRWLGALTLVQVRELLEEVPLLPANGQRHLVTCVGRQQTPEAQPWTSGLIVLGAWSRREDSGRRFQKQEDERRLEKEMQGEAERRERGGGSRVGLGGVYTTPGLMSWVMVMGHDPLGEWALVTPTYTHIPDVW